MNKYAIEHASNISIYANPSLHLFAILIIFLFFGTTIVAEEPLPDHRLMADASWAPMADASLAFAADASSGCKPFWLPCDSLAGYTLALPSAKESGCGSICSASRGCPGTRSTLMYSSS